MSFEGLFKFQDINEKNYEDNIRENYNVSENEPCCDHYGHAYNCEWFLEEIKAADVRKAIKQLSNTADKIILKGDKLDRIFIIGKLNKTDSKVFNVRGKKLYKKGRGQPIMIQNIVVELFYRKDLDNKGDLRWLFI